MPSPAPRCWPPCWRPDPPARRPKVTRPPPSALPADATLAYVGTLTGTRGQSKGIYVFRLQTRGLEVSQNITLVPLGAGGRDAEPVLPGAGRPAPPAVRGQRDRSLPGQAQRRGQRLRHRFRHRQAEAHQPAALDGHQPLPPGAGQAGHATCWSPTAAAAAWRCCRWPPTAGWARPPSVVQHTGKSVHPQRQTGPHVLGVALDPGQQIRVRLPTWAWTRCLAYRLRRRQGQAGAATTPPTH